LTPTSARPSASADGTSTECLDRRGRPVSAMVFHVVTVWSLAAPAGRLGAPRTPVRAPQRGAAGDAPTLPSRPHLFTGSPPWVARLHTYGFPERPVESAHEGIRSGRKPAE
jgi:hypothetical protein